MTTLRGARCIYDMRLAFKEKTMVLESTVTKAEELLTMVMQRVQGWTSQHNANGNGNGNGNSNSNSNSLAFVASMFLVKVLSGEIVAVRTFDEDRRLKEHLHTCLSKSMSIFLHH